MIGFSFDYNKLDGDKFTKDTDGISMVEFLKYCTIITPEGNKPIEVSDRNRYFFEQVSKARKLGNKLLWLKYIGWRRV